MQHLNLLMCSQTAQLTSNILTDIRDDKQYYITKEKDNLCWMTQNLDTDIKRLGTQMGTEKDSTFVAFSNVYTNLIDKEYWEIPNSSQGYNTQTGAAIVYWNYYGCSGGNVETYTWTSTTYSSTSHCNTGYEARSYDPGNICIPFNGSNLAASDAKTQCSTAIGAANHNNVGNLYNQHTLSAGSSNYSIDVKYTNIENSICPKGWTAPKGSQTPQLNNQWNTLLNSTSSAIPYKDDTNRGFSATLSMMQSILGSPVYLVRGGHYPAANGSLQDSSQGIYYWSRTIHAAGITNDYSQYGSSMGYPGTGQCPRGYGNAVRCVLQY